MESVRLANIRIGQNSDFQLILKHTDKETGLPVNFAGVLAVRMDLRAAKSQNSALIQRFELGDGVTVEVDPVSQVANTLKFVYDNIDWPAQTLYYDVFIIQSNGHADRWYNGEIIVYVAPTERPEL